jgi:quercetin dioxygenase-like cupin family protein
MRRSALTVALAFLVAPVFAQDPVAVDSAHHEVVLENENVRVLRARFGPRDKTLPHVHPPGVAVFLTDGRYLLSADGEAPAEVQRKRGGAVLAPGGKHTVENLTDTPGEVVHIELKTPPASAWTPPARDALKVDPAHYTLLGENDRVRVIHIRYGAGEKSVIHDHPANVAVFLTDGHGKMGAPDGTSVAVEMKSGTVRYSGGESHLPQNAGSEPFEVVVVELKSTMPTPAKP